VKTETEIADEQAGFRQGRGTKDQITNLRILMHKAHEHQQPLYMCFVDFKKVFDFISHDKLWVTMMDMGYPLHLIDLLAKLYRKQLAKVKVGDRGITAENMEKSQHTDFNEDTTNESASVACSNKRL